MHETQSKELKGIKISLLIIISAYSVNLYLVGYEFTFSQISNVSSKHIPRYDNE